MDQLLSSASNFALSVVAGRLLGPAGLGVVFLGFSSYLIALGFLRALVIHPLVVTSADIDEEDRLRATARALTACAAGAIVAALVALVAGSLVPGDVGRGIRIFAPWLAPAIVQDLWRSILFRDGSGGKAAANDAVWLATMALTLPLAVRLDTDWAVAAWWGVGALAGALLGFVQLRVRAGGLRESWAWWRTGASLSGWLLLESAVVYGGAQGAIFVLAPILGSAAMGGLRAAETLFVPMSFLKPAVELPGLPILSRAVRTGPAGRALGVAAQMSALAMAVTLAYVLAMGLLGGRILEQVFGPAFAGFDSLVIPFGTAQAFAALAVGFVVLLKAQRRGRALVGAGCAGAVVALVLAPTLGAASGVRGAAWGMAAASGAAAVTTVALAARSTPVRGRP